MPRWIEQQSTKAKRQREAHEALVARALKLRAERPVRDAFHAELIEAAKERERPRHRAMSPGIRRLPDLSDEELAQALGKAHRQIPRHLDYPHLLIFRERGYTRIVMADTGTGEFGVPTFRGDVLTEVGEQWLKRTAIE